MRREIRGRGEEGLTFGALVEMFLQTYRSRGGTGYYKERSETWLSVFPAEAAAASITSLDVERFRNLRSKAGAGPSTVRKDLISLGTLFRWAVGKDLLQTNPADPSKVKRPSEPAAREAHITEAELSAVLEAAPSDTRALIEWLFYSGMRLGEALKLRWRDLDKRTGWIYVAAGKTGKARRVPYFAELRPIADALPRPLKAELVFGTDANRPSHR